MSELVATVHVSDVNGAFHMFGPGDDVPAWAVARIRNPQAWADGVVPDGPVEKVKQVVEFHAVNETVVEEVKKAASKAKRTTSTRGRAAAKAVPEAGE